MLSGLMHSGVHSVEGLSFLEYTGVSGPSSELATPAPSSASECAPPPPACGGGWGGGVPNPTTGEKA
jgi:hypothetical protein